MKNKFLLALLITLALCIAIGAGVIISSLLNPEEEPETFNGTYYLQLKDIGQASYTLKDDGTGVRSYSSGGELVTEEFSYAISGELGSRKISFTWNNSGKTEVYDFSSGTYDGKDAIFINDEPYCKE